MGYKVFGKIFNTYQEAQEYARTVPHNQEDYQIIEETGDSPDVNPQWYDSLNLPSWLRDALDVGDGSLGDRRKGQSFTNTQQSENIMNYVENREQREWNEAMYQRYESYSGKMNQMKEAGLNPAMMFGDAGSSSGVQSTSPAAASGGSSPTSNTGLNDAMGVMGSILSLITGGSQIISQQKQAGAAVQNAQTQSSAQQADAALKAEQMKTEQAKQANLAAQTTGIQNENSVFDEKMQWQRVNQFNKQVSEELGNIHSFVQIYKTAAEIDSIKTNTDIQKLRYFMDYNESLSRISVNNANATLLGEQFKLVSEEVKKAGFENELNELKKLYGVGDDALCLHLLAVQQSMSPLEFSGYLLNIRDYYTSAKHSVDVWKIPSFLLSYCAPKLGSKTDKIFGGGFNPTLSGDDIPIPETNGLFDKAFDFHKDLKNKLKGAFDLIGSRP